jgi:hypothetical protein
VSSIFWALAGELEFFAGAGAVSPVRAAIEPAKIKHATRIGGPPSLRRMLFHKNDCDNFWSRCFPRKRLLNNRKMLGRLAGFAADRLPGNSLLPDAVS